jgi:hypothetical protein
MLTHKNPLSYRKVDNRDIAEKRDSLIFAKFVPLRYLVDTLLIRWNNMLAEVFIRENYIFISLGF